MGEPLPVRRMRADLAVVGAGPAGIAAAVSAAESGARVIVLDEGLRPGGQIWRHRSRASLPRRARRWLEALDRSGAEVLCGASVADAAADADAGLGLRADVRRTDPVDPAGALDVYVSRVVLATGARERFLPFPGWTLPNVLGVGGAQALLKSGASFTGKRVVIAGSGPLLLPVAASLARAGARIALVAEQASGAAVRRFGAGLWRSPGKVVQAARYRATFRSARYACGTWAVRAVGDAVLREVVLTDGRRTWTEACDLLCIGQGLVPSTELARLLGCRVQQGRVVTDAWQCTSVPEVYCAGEPTGIGGVDGSLVEGEIAGLAATARPVRAEACFARRDRQRRFAARLDAAFAPRAELRELAEHDTIVCRCEGIAYGRLRPEWSVRQAKLYTRAGMGPCQARVCGPALEHLFGWRADTVRAPIVPVSAGALVGSSVGAQDEPVQSATPASPAAHGRPEALQGETQ